MANLARTCRIGLWLLALTCMPSVCAAGIRYDVTDLGSGHATAINKHGEVVGYVSGWNWSDAWYWHPSTGREVIDDPSHRDKVATDINDAGIIVGLGPFVYNVRARVFLDHLGSGFEGVNRYNVAVGREYYRTRPNGIEDYYSIAYDIDTGIKTYIYTYDSHAYAVNDLTVAVGSRNGNRYAFVNNAGVASALVGFPQGDNDSRCCAYDINDLWPLSSRGMIVGRARYTGDVWNQVGPTWWDSAGNPHMIGRLGTGTNGQAHAVNNAGQIVGWSDTAGIGGQTAILYEGGALTALNSLINSGSTMTVAYDINDRGQIVGYGPAGAMLLNPVYFADGNFQAGDLGANWKATGDGTAALTDLGDGNLAAVLTAGSPVTVSQDVATPGTVFDLSFDYDFLSTDPSCTLTVVLDNPLLAGPLPLFQETLAAPSTLVGQFTTYVVRIQEPGLQGLDAAVLAFTYDGPTGTQCLIDNVAITQVPEPASLMLVMAGVALTGGRLRRRD